MWALQGVANAGESTHFPACQTAALRAAASKPCLQPCHHAGIQLLLAIGLGYVMTACGLFSGEKFLPQVRSQRLCRSSAALQPPLTSLVKRMLLAGQYFFAAGVFPSAEFQRNRRQPGFARQ